MSNHYIYCLQVNVLSIFPHVLNGSVARVIHGCLMPLSTIF